MKKFMLATASVASAVLLLAGCASSGDTGEAKPKPAANENAPEGLVKEGALTVCIDPEYPPLEYYADGSGGEIVGFDADSVRALADHWGLETNFEVTSFDGLMPGVQTGKCDMIFGGLYQSAERAEVADSVAIMAAGPAVLAAPESVDKISDGMSLCGMRVVSQAASSNSMSVQKLSEECEAAGKPAITHTEYPKTAETVLAVINGKADALVETNVAAAYMATQNEGQLEVVNTVFDPDTTFGAFMKLESPLAAPLAEALDALHADGTLQKIAAEYNLDESILDVKR